LAFFAKVPRCLVGMEACATAHYWAREIAKLGHDVRLIPPAGACPSGRLAAGSPSCWRVRGELMAILADPADRRIPTPLHEGLLAIVETLRGLERRIEIVDKQIVGWGRGNQTCRHLITIPGCRPILSSAMAAIAVDPATFGSGRHFSASRGRVPRQDGTGGKGLPRRRRGSSSVRSASAATAICAGGWSTACPRA
jgi:transposase